MAGSKPESLLVMPYSGKYCEVVSDNRVYKIWKVHPNTPNSYGTLIPYDVGIYFLSKVPPIITLVSEVKGGKFVNTILEEDQKKIKESLQRGFIGSFKNYNVKPISEASSGDPNALNKALELLAAQVAKNTELQGQVSSLVSRLDKLEKAGPAIHAEVPITP